MNAARSGAGAAVLVAALVCAAAPAAGAGEVGAALFDGGPAAAVVEARVGPGAGVPVPASRFACRACHGRDGRGGREGGAAVPPIAPDALAAPTAGRPAYDAAAFTAAVRDGVDPAGRRLAPLMPRYALGDADGAGLFARLGEVAARERTGVSADAVRFGVPPDAGADLVAAFRRAWLDRGDPRLHGRRLVVETVDAAGVEGVFALLFAPHAPRDADPARAPQGGPLGAPALFPLAALRGEESTERVRGLFASRSDQAAALLREAPADALLLADEDGRPALESAAAAVDGGRRIESLDEAPPTPAVPALVVVASPAGWRRLAAQLRPAAGTAVYGCLDEAVGVAGESRRRGVRLVLADPRPVPVGDATGPLRPARDRLAVAAAAVLETALGAAGRDLTRGALMRALADLAVEPAQWPALDYRRAPLTGSRDVRLLRLEPTP